MRIVTLTQESKQNLLEDLLKRSPNNYGAYEDKVAAIVDDVRKRIEKRKRPLNDHNFKKLYNGMIRLMVMMIVVLGSLIVLKNPELEQKIFNQKYLQQLITFVSQSVLDFLPEDVKVSQELQYTLIKDDYYKGTGNQVLAMNNGKVIDVKKQQVTILDENGTEITFSKLKDIQVKKFQKIKLLFRCLNIGFLNV